MGFQLHKDEYGNFIGRGEDTIFTILKETYPEADIQRQYKFSKLLNKDFELSVTERQEKETLDFVIFRPSQMPLVIRVQDPHHAGNITAMRDKVQRKTLEWCDCIVVDVQHYNCPNIFKEKDNINSRVELQEAFADSGIELEV
jgi:hypothetical protein